MKDKINEAVRTIIEIRENMPEFENKMIRHQLAQMYRLGYVKALEWVLENKKKHDKR